MYKLSGHDHVSAPELVSEALTDISKGEIRDAFKAKGPDWIEHPVRRLTELAIAAPASVVALPIGVVAAIGAQIETGAWRYAPVRQGHQLEKIRTIRPGQEPDGHTSVIIPETGSWGNLLRKGPDELPHLYLVLRGLGSIVSPRALTEEAKAARQSASPSLYDEFIERASLEAKHVSLLPGMFDPPSIYGHDHPNDSSAEMLRSQMKLGLQWIDNTSLRNDFSILRQAARVTLGKPSGIVVPDDTPPINRKL